jgi:hypothetical protein
MRGISTVHGATNQQAPSKKKPKIKLRLKRALRHIKDKIRNKVMDAFRNAKDIILTNNRITKLESKLKESIDDPRESKIDYALEAFRASEAQHTKTINSKLLLLIMLWVLDKIVLFIFFMLFNAAS